MSLIKKKIIRVLHIINIKCDKYTRKFIVTDKTKKQIKALTDKYYIKGINFPKIIEYYE